MENKIGLRAVEPEDVEFIYDCERDPSNARWSDYRAPFSKAQLQTYALTYDADPFRAGQLRLIIETGEGNAAGILDLYDISEKDSKAYVGICIHPRYRNIGIAKEALKELNELARERLGLKKLVAKISSKNPAAIQLFKKDGYREIALLPEWHRIGTDYHDMLLLCKDTEI